MPNKMKIHTAMAELKLASGIIVTRGEEGLVEVEAGKIAIVPAWRFLLNLEQGQGL